MHDDCLVAFPNVIRESGAINLQNIPVPDNQLQHLDNFAQQSTTLSIVTMTDYSTLPSGATLKPKPYKAHVPEEKLQLLKDLVKISPIAAPTFENTNAGRHFGMEREWLIKAKEEWTTTFDWRKQEDRINSFPNFIVSVKDDQGIETNIQFLALFSKKKDAIPIAFYHGWPGSILEFLSLLELLKKKYPSPEELPYHVIVPSLPGYAFSSGPPVDQDYSMEQAAMCLDKLMRGLGFSKYLAQGGDLGSFVSRIQASASDACVGMHLNMLPMGPPENQADLKIDEVEAAAMPRGQQFRDSGSSYALEHGTRTATIGLALTASPIAMLSW
jgi:microsomal epoxide hydrolase